MLLKGGHVPSGMCSKVASAPFPGGTNFDAKLRRESTDMEDLFYGHISGIDALAFGLRKAAQIIEVFPFPKS